METQTIEARALPKASLGRRVSAALIDGAVVFVVGLIPLIGVIIGLAYVLTRDSIVYTLRKNESFKNRSLGKKLLGLRVVNLSGADEVDIMMSIKRNSILVIGAIIGFALSPIIAIVVASMVATVNPYAVGMSGIVGFLGLLPAFLVMIVSLLPAAVESLLVIANRSGVRLGDKFANTHVAED